MTDTSNPATAPKRRDPWRIAFAVAGILLVAGGLMLTYLGVGADLGRERPITVTIRAVDLPRESLGRVKVGDSLYTEPAGMYIGRVAKITEGPMLEAAPDSGGMLHASPNPVKAQMEIVIEASGRQAEGVTAVGSQVISVGQRFAVYTASTFIEGIAIDVRVH